MENIKLEKVGKIPTDKDIEGRIVLDVETNTFTLHHTENYDVVDVYMLLSAALDFIEAEAEAQVERESRYLQ